MENEKIMKKPSKVGAVFYGLLLIIIYLVIMSVVQVFALVPVITETVSDMAGDVATFQDIYLQKLAEHADMVTITTFVGTVLAAGVMVLWYYFAVYKKSVKDGTYESVVLKLKDVKSIMFLVTSSAAGYAFAVLVERFLVFVMPNSGNAILSTLGAVLNGVDALGFILAVFIAPIGEEVCLRGLAMNRAKKSFGLTGCIILSGILFGIYHMNIIQGIYAISIGIVFGFVAYKYNSVIPCIICHLVNNLIAMFSGVLGFENTFIVPIAVMVVCGVLAVILATKLEFMKSTVVQSLKD